MEEDIIIKILKFCMQAFLSCKNANMYYPEFCLENLYINEKNKLNVSASDLNAKSENLGKEVKFMHPFLFKNFFKQIELKNSDESNIKNCKCFNWKFESNNLSWEFIGFETSEKFSRNRAHSGVVGGEWEIEQGQGDGDWNEGWADYDE